MQAREADPRPICVQIAEDLRSLILSEELVAENRVPSTKKLSEFHQVDPTTATRAMTGLPMVELAERKRGLDIFVIPGARERVQAECHETFQRTYIEPLKAEADVLGPTPDNITAMLEEEK